MYWAAKVSAETAVRDRKVWEEMPESSAIDWIKQAHRRDRDAAANRGTEVHRLAEEMRDGAELDVPEELVGHVDSYVQFLADFAPEPLVIEGVCGSRKHHYMGTFDSIEDMLGERWLLDIKTNRSGPFGEVALQLAAYRSAEFLLDAEGREQPMPAVDRCGVVWVTDTGYELFEFQAGAAEFRSFLYVQQVGQFLERADSLKSEPLPIPEPEEAA
jgi:hypothetical protein